MTKRDNHYEAAFEAFLRTHGVPYVAVDETRRALLAEDSLKSLDFIVSPPGGERWLVDVKGRRFPSGDGKHYWKNWSTQDDLRSLGQWQQLFGEGFRSLFVFAFDVVGPRAPLPPEQLFAFREHVYGFVGVAWDDYLAQARMISPKWETLAMSSRAFRGAARPVLELFLGSAASSGASHPPATASLASPAPLAFAPVAQASASR